MLADTARIVPLIGAESEVVCGALVGCEGQGQGGAAEWK